MNNGNYGWSDKQETPLRLAESLADNNHLFKIKDLQEATYSDLLPAYFTRKYRDGLGVIDYEAVRLMQDKDITNSLNYLDRNTEFWFNYSAGQVCFRGGLVDFHRATDNTWYISFVKGWYADGKSQAKSYANLLELLSAICEDIEEAFRYECEMEAFRYGC